MAETQAQALRNALVLLRAFASSSWRSLETASGGMRLSISRMTAAELAAMRGASSLTSPAIEKPRLLTAPHVASLREIAAVGATLRAGETYATLEILDEIVDLRADEDFCVISRQCQPGQLLEFGSPLIGIS